MVIVTSFFNGVYLLKPRLINRLTKKKKKRTRYKFTTSLPPPPLPPVTNNIIFQVNTFLYFVYYFFFLPSSFSYAYRRSEERSFFSLARPSAAYGRRFLPRILAPYASITYRPKEHNISPPPRGNRLPTTRHARARVPVCVNEEIYGDYHRPRKSSARKTGCGGGGGGDDDDRACVLKIEIMFFPSTLSSLNDKVNIAAAAAALRKLRTQLNCRRPTIILYAGGNSAVALSDPRSAIPRECGHVDGIFDGNYNRRQDPGENDRLVFIKSDVNKKNFHAFRND